jgi:hypothetical protein
VALSTIDQTKQKDRIVIVAYRQMINVLAISWREQFTFRRDDDDVRFVLDQHA